MNSFVSSASSLACSAPVRTCVGRRQDLLDLLHELLGRDVRASRRPRSRRACPACRRAAAPSAGRSPRASRRRSTTTEPNWTMPGDAQPAAPAPRPGRRSSRRRRSPPCPRSPSSTTTSFGPGHAPSTSVSGLNGESGFAIAEAEVRARRRRRSPCRRRRSAGSTRRRRRPRPRRRSGRARTSASSDSSNGGCRRAALVGEVERRLAGDDRVGALADVGEDRVESLVDRVRSARTCR